ncbi:MAG TPA: transcriptional regulator, partial [Kribbella sp.]|uniref:MmyB family transcriptional regulator n=1 Tax=Kribbella sp. TaxID=1871183 RepID=UPI002D789DD6
AGEHPGPPPGPPADVRTGVLRMLARLDVPGLVLDAKYDVLAWNPLAAALITDFSTLPLSRRNLLRLRFLSGTTQGEIFGEEATQEFAREAAAELRAATGKYPEDPSIAALVAELLTGSEEFARIWALHEVGTQQSMCQTVHHPVVGRIDLICEVLVIPERDQRVVLYTAEPGSPSDDALRLLEVVGTQSLTGS